MRKYLLRRILQVHAFGVASQIRSIGNRPTEDDDDDDLARFLVSNTPIKSVERSVAPQRSEVVATTPIPAAQTYTEPVTPPADPAVVRVMEDYRHWSRSFVRTRLLPNPERTYLDSCPPFVMEWLCVRCMQYSSEGTNRCSFCSTDAWKSKKQCFPPVKHQVAVPESWWCTTCKVVIKADPGKEMDPLGARMHCFCAKCKAAFRGVRSWYCTQCELINPKGAARCEMCAQDRPAAWTCQSCLSTNCIFELKCADCDTARVVKKETDHLISCSSCSELNGGSWEICSACAHPLPTMNAVKSVLSRRLQLEQPPANIEQARGSSPSTNNSKLLRHPGPALVNIVSPPPKESDKWLCPICFRDNSKTVLECSGCRFRAAGKNVKKAQPKTWNCQSCGGLNPIEASVCTACGEVSPVPAQLSTPKQPPAAVSITPASPSSNQPVTILSNGKSSASPLKPGEWRCHKCSSSNSPLTRNCVKCSTARVIAPGYWQCDKCFSVNKNSRDACVGCFTQHKPTSAAASTPAQWTCYKCSATNSQSSSICASCSASQETWKCLCPRDLGLNSVKCDVCSMISPQSWRCLSCARVNRDNDSTCANCSEYRGEHWFCSECKSKCGAGTAACTICGKSRPIPQMWCCSICREWNNGRSCSRCNTTPAEGQCETVSSHWDCAKCHVRNGARFENCKNCLARRILPNLSLTLTCQQCQSHVDVGPSETCSNCQASLSQQLTVFLGKHLHFAKATFKPASQGKVTVSVAAVESGVDQAVVSSDTGECLMDEDLLLQSYLAPEGSAAGSESDAASVSDQFWTCSLCSVKNPDGVSDCTVCGVVRGED